MIVDCASTAVFHAMVAARERAGGPLHNLVVYLSDQTHSSVEKAAIAAGIDRANIRCIDLRVLGQTVRADIASGLRPFFVAATVGTTSSAAIDLVPAIAYVCHKRRLWLHVDGAYGGAFGLLPECRHFLEGVERADSFIVNPHKGMMVPLDCSLLYTARPEAFRAAFMLRPEYLKTDAETVDFTDYGLALGRRFRALKLWFVLRYFGREGIAANLRKNLRLAAWLAGRVGAHPRLALAAPVTMGLVCFRVRSGDDATRDLMRRLNDARRFFVSHTVLDGKVAIRVAIGNVGTRSEDIEELWEGITAALSQSLAMGTPTASSR
jgi:aromatic-L-amino-acid decarboxylase